MVAILLGFLHGIVCASFFWGWLTIGNIERDALDALILADEISLRAIEFEQQDLDEIDLVTQWATKILSHAGYQFDMSTGEWIREVIE